MLGFFFFLIFFSLKVVDTHLGIYVLLVSWNRNTKQLNLTKLMQDKFLNTPNFRGRDK